MKKALAGILAMSMAVPAAGHSAGAEEAKKEYIVMYSAAQVSEAQQAALRQSEVVHNVNAGSEYRDEMGMALLLLTDTEAGYLEGQPGVLLVEEDQAVYGLADQIGTVEMETSSNPYDYVLPPAVTDGSSSDALPWNIEMVAGDPRDTTYRGSGVKIAVIDSGIDVHDDLDTAGWVDFSDTVEGFKPIDHNGHGTMVAGILYARISGFGMMGIASEADVYSVKVLDRKNSARVSSVIQAIGWCIEQGIDIINMSFGMAENSEALSLAIEMAYESGILIVAAAGNGGGSLQYPAACDHVIAVGAVDESAQPADFSARGTGLDLTAPGVDVQTTRYLGDYGITSGTSAAAAHVTGAAAVLKGIAPDKSNEYIRQILEASAYKPGFDSWDERYGYGIVSAERAVQMHLALEAGTDTASVLSGSVPTYDIDGDFSEENGFVKGSWGKSFWDDYGRGHVPLVNNTPDTCFGAAGSSLNTQRLNKTIAAKAAFLTDDLGYMGAGANGNRVIATGEEPSDSETRPVAPNMSPYHAKAQGDGSGFPLSTVLNQHLPFLYELARRRIVRQESFDMNSANYSGNNYYGITIDNLTKRRIVNDLSKMYHEEMLTLYGESRMHTTESQGWMIAGVYLHLLGDIFAHRAKIIKSMAFSENSVNSTYDEMTMVPGASGSRIDEEHIPGSKRQALYDKLTATGGIPAIRLKDYLFGKDDEQSILYNGTYLSVSAAQAYEDNPFFYSHRYEASEDATEESLEDMWLDTGQTTTFSFEDYEDSRVPLVDWILD